MSLINLEYVKRQSEWELSKFYIFADHPLSLDKWERLKRFCKFSTYDEYLDDCNKNILNQNNWKEIWIDD